MGVLIILYLLVHNWRAQELFFINTLKVTLWLQFWKVWRALIAVLCNLDFIVYNFCNYIEKTKKFHGIKFIPRMRSQAGTLSSKCKAGHNSGHNKNSKQELFMALSNTSCPKKWNNMVFMLNLYLFFYQEYSFRACE